jgi:hypothetical protein
MVAPRTTDIDAGAPDCLRPGFQQVRKAATVHTTSGFMCET